MKKVAINKNSAGYSFTVIILKYVTTIMTKDQPIVTFTAFMENLGDSHVRSVEAESRDKKQIKPH